MEDVSSTFTFLLYSFIFAQRHECKPGITRVIPQFSPAVSNTLHYTRACTNESNFLRAPQSGQNETCLRLSFPPGLLCLFIFARTRIRETIKDPFELKRRHKNFGIPQAQASFHFRHKIYILCWSPSRPFISIRKNAPSSCNPRTSEWKDNRPLETRLLINIIPLPG